MRGDELLNQMEFIDPAYIEAADVPQKSRKNAFIKRGAVAACFCMVFAAAMFAMTEMIQKPVQDLGSNGGLVSSSESPKTITDADADIDSELSDDNSLETEQIKWLTEDEIINAKNQSGAVIIGGVDVPSYVAYQGAFYAVLGEGSAEQSRFALTEDKVKLNESYEKEVYLVENDSDCIALLFNGGLNIYQKQFDVTFELDGVTYGIVYEAFNHDALGDVLLSNDSFIVYSATFYTGETNEQSAYVVDILPKLKADGYSLFLEDEIDYADAWWVAVPIQP